MDEATFLKPLIHSNLCDSSHLQLLLLFFFSSSVATTGCMIAVGIHTLSVAFLMSSTKAEFN